MAYIYMDESGDLGFDMTKTRTSKFFIITFLVTKDEKIPNWIIKKFFQWLKGRNIKIKSWIFHSYRESSESISKLLTSTTQKDVKIMTLILDKQKVYTNFQDQKHMLYNRVVNVLIDSLITYNLFSDNEKVIFIASRRETNRTLNENFLEYLKNRHKDQPNIEFIIKPPQEKWLQIVDTLCFAVYQKYEHKNDEYYNIIEKKILIEKMLFE